MNMQTMSELAYLYNKLNNETNINEVEYKANKRSFKHIIATIIILVPLGLLLAT